MAGRIDFSAFGLQAEDLASLRVLSGEWAQAVAAAFPKDERMSADFASATGELAASVADAGWQDRWLRLWRAQFARGVPGSRLVVAMDAALAVCGQAIMPAGPVSRLHLELASLLRRTCMAALSCAVELAEELQVLDSGAGGERAAWRGLEDILAAEQMAAVLSIALVSRRLSSLSGDERHVMRTSVEARIRQLMRAKDCLHAGPAGEWLLLLPEIRSKTQPALAASRIVHDLSLPMALPGGRSLCLEAVVGVAMLPEHAADPAEALAACRLPPGAAGLAVGGGVVRLVPSRYPGRMGR